MDVDELLDQDRVAKEWIKEIDSFQSPPPPRRLADLNGLEERQRNGITASTTPASSVVHSRDGSYSTDASGLQSNAEFGRNDAELPPENFIVEKVRQFEDNDAHPYASHRRVETSKKIAAQGGNLAAFLINDKSKQRISKEEASKLRATVLQENRVYNPYPNPYSGSTPVNENEGSRRADPSNSSGSSGTSSMISHRTGDSSSSLPAGVSSHRNDDRSATTGSHQQQSRSVAQRPSNEAAQNNKPSLLGATLSQAVPNAPGEDGYATPAAKNAKECFAIKKECKPNGTQLNGDGNSDGGRITPGMTFPAPVKHDAVGSHQNNGSHSTPQSRVLDKSIEDIEMEKLYRAFDHELEMVSSRQKLKDQGITADKTPLSLGGTSQKSEQYQRRHPLPPYTGIRHHSARVANSASPVPLSSDSRNLFSPPVPRERKSSLSSILSPHHNGATLPPLPVRQSQWKQQNYPAPVAQRRPSGENGYYAPGGVIARSFGENGNGNNGVSSSVPPPPVPPPPPGYSRPRQGVTPIADRIPAHEMEAFSPTSIPRSASHTYQSPWNQQNGRSVDIAVDGRISQPASHVNGGTVNTVPWHQQYGHTSAVSISQSNRIASNGIMDNSAAERQQRMWNDLEKKIVDDLERKAVPIGLCYQCGSKVTNPLDATQALGHLYHAQCFTCFSCGRPLKGKKFYEARGKVYCEEDYLYSGFQHSAERCAACGHLIMDMILQAVGKSFHPGCFKCHECRRGLENVPFTADDQGLVYCVDDYHRLFAPRCAKCTQPIAPINGREETVRVVAMGRDYHIDCYACEACGLRLTDEDEKRCYPLGEHLLCQRCHVYWSRTGGVSQPITDL